MAKYKFTSNLSVTGIEELKKKLQRYKDYTLQRKIDLIVQNLIELGADVANAAVNQTKVGQKYVKISVKIDDTKGEHRGYIISTGAIMEQDGYEPFNIMLAVEFGAGIHHNGKANPKAAEFGLGVGTFPGQVHAFDDGWWYFDDETGTWKYSHGIKATMPMYNADKAILENYVKVVREVAKSR